ncbi:MAG: phosphotransferase enzyme family protein [Acidobacteriota bacterium]
MARLSYDLRSIGRNFQISGEFLAAVPHGSGHINDTFAATYRRGGSSVRYIHQRINQHVFRDPECLMENVLRVTEHIRHKLGGEKEGDARRVLSIVPSRQGRPWCRDDAGNYWRTYRFIEGARSHDVIRSRQQAFQVARAFGSFQKQLVDLPPPRLGETIPDFHNTPKRFEAFRKAVERDARNRATRASREIDLIEREAGTMGPLVRLQQLGQLPERIIHNDTKVNNVLIDETTSEGICVIDLDTVMPGLAVYDFGDMVRTATSPAREDALNLEEVEVRMDIFEALAGGYLSAAGDFLNENEKDCLAFSGRLITLELAMRFLTDYLGGDTYFRIHREHQNLDRCRAQLRLFQELSRKEEQMERVIGKIRREGPLPH